MKKKMITILLVLIVFLPTSNADIERRGPNLYVAGVQTNEFRYFASPEQYGKQRQANWCWAACIQMVLNYHGLRVSQEQIVTRIYGANIDAPANPNQILGALSGWAPDIRGRFSSIHASPYPMHGSQIVQDLAYKWPLIVCFKGNPIGHVYVLTAVTYSVDQFNNPFFHTVILRDPWPDSQSRIEISYQEFMNRQNFICRVSVIRR